MNITKKLDHTVLLMSTSIAYLTWIWLDYINLDFLIQFQISKGSLIYYLIKFAISFLITYGFYKLVLDLLYSVLRRNKRFLKLMYGKYYLAGEWVSFYKMRNELRIILSDFEQTFDGLKVKGIGYSLDGNIQSDWKWENAYINTGNDTLISGYTDNNVKRDTATYGNAVLNLVDEYDKTTVLMIGFLYETHLGHKINTIIYKIPFGCKFKSFNEKLAYIRDTFSEDANIRLSLSKADAEFIESR